MLLISFQLRISFTRGSSYCLYFILPLVNHAFSTLRFSFTLFNLFAKSEAMSSKMTIFFPLSWRRLSRILILVLLDKNLTMTGLGLAGGVDL